MGATAMSPEMGPVFRDTYLRALEFVHPIYGDRILGTNELVLAHAIGTANNLVLLKLDEASIASGLLFAVPDYLPDYRDRIESAFGADVAGIIGNIARLHQLRLVTRSATMSADAAAKAHQFEVLRKMLLAMVEDIRAVLVRLASRTQTMHSLGGAIPAVQLDIARETLDIYAPLANRLGVWQLKSVLEDAAFRILDPPAFNEVTALIDERHGERDAFISACVAKLQSELKEAGIEAAITGRPKHIYSIWNKMRRKGR